LQNEVLTETVHLVRLRGESAPVENSVLVWHGRSRRNLR
jgi:hypothetical protein